LERLLMLALHSRERADGEADELLVRRFDTGIC